MSWIERIKSNITPTRKASIPEGVWTKCDSCGQVLYRAELERNLEVCPKCDHHMRMTARNRLHSLLDEGSLVELGSELEPKDVLKFRDSKKYKDRLASAQKETGEKDALVVMKGTLYGMPVVAAAFEFAFMGGSMGSVVGARFVRAVEQALEDNCPLICFSASGGARMQEALMSLMQMAEKEVEDAARLLGEMRRGCQQAEEQLKMLIDYQNEYRNNLNSDMSAGMTSNRWISYQQFIQTLEKAITQHRQQLNQWTQKVDIALNSWREKKQRLQAWQTLQERQSTAALLAENRLDQKKMDEFAQRAAMRKPE